MSTQMVERTGHYSADDEALVDRIVKSGDKNHFEPIVERYKRPIMKLLYRMTGDYETSMELAQETFLKAWNYLKSYHREMKFHSWLFKIAHNLAIDHISKKRRRMENETPLDEVAQDFKKNGWEKRVEGGMYVQSLLDKLRDPYRTAVILRFMEDLTYEDIASIMETTVEQVKNYLFRGRKYLLELAGEVKYDGI